MATSSGKRRRAKMVADKVLRETALLLSNNPIKEYLTVLDMRSVIEKVGTKMLLMEYTTIGVFGMTGPVADEARPRVSGQAHEKRWH